MITSTLKTTPSISVGPPPISFPFLWRGEISGRVFLRYASYDTAHGAQRRDVDICLILGDAGDHTFKTGVPSVVIVNDEEAWRNRLPSHSSVLLQNSVTN